MMVKLLYEEETQKRLDFWEKELINYGNGLLGIITPPNPEDATPVQLLENSNKAMSRMHADPGYRKILDALNKVRETAIPIGYMMFGDDPTQPTMTIMEPGSE